MEDFLRSVGLDARAAAFREQGITADLLADLTDADLRELGLTIAERKHFFRAVAGTFPAKTPAGLAEQHPERRPLSTMFVDLVGYSRLSERLDPEDMLALLRRYRELCQVHTSRFGGYVARVVGDGVLAYFCYPMANENDPERAVRAGLEIAAGVGELATPDGERLRARLGIATGPVVIGDLYRDSAVDKHSVVGTAPNLAARLQALGQPGELIIDEGTYAKVRGRFVAADMGEFALRGLGQPHRAWKILRERPVGDVASVPHHAPLCGRDRELGELQAHWARARASSGNAVVVIGRAGIGKSRLVRAFLESCAGDGGLTVQIHASALDTDSPLRAVVAALRRLTGGGGAAGGAARRRRLAALNLPVQTLPPIIDLLGLSPDPGGAANAEAAERTPDQRREDILLALVDAARGVARRQPLRLVVEDMHWLDPTSLDLMGRLAAAVTGQQMLLILTAREEMRGELATLPATHSVLPLPPLPELEVLRLVGAMLAGAAMPPAVLRSIARRAEGVPLFAQEMLRTVAVRRGTEPEDEADELGALVPASVHAALVARLDRTGPAKEIAQAAAVFGRSCRREALAAVCGPLFGTSGADLDNAIDMLVRTGIFAPSTSESGAAREHRPDMLVFTHALLRDASYDSLVRDRRQTLHAQVALALRATEPDSVAEQPEQLALHLTEGGDPMAAAPFWLAAVRRGLERSALTEATRLLRRAMASLPRAADDQAVAETRLEMLALLGPALMTLRGAGSPEVAEVYAEANVLCQDLPETHAHFPIYWGWWRLSRDFHHKRDRASTMLSRARARNDPELLLQAHHCTWASLYSAGDYKRCCEHIEAGLTIYNATDCRHHAKLYGNHDARVCAHGELSQVFWMQGKPRRAMEQEALSLAWAGDLDHVGSHWHSRDMQLLHRTFRRDVAAVSECAAAMVRLGTEQGSPDARGKGLIFQGWALAIQGQAATGLQALEEGFAQQQASGTIEDFPLYVCLMADALIAAGQARRATERLAAAEVEYERLGLSFWRSELRRMRAEAGLAGGSGDRAEAFALFQQAQAIAEAQFVPMLALRAAVGAARVEIDFGRGIAARRRLLQALAGISDQDDSADLIAAHDLMARVGGLAA